jgi:hypothetical protein
VAAQEHLEDELMRKTMPTAFVTRRKISLLNFLLGVVILLLADGIRTYALAQSGGEQTFATPAAASAALVKAAREHDRKLALKVLGVKSQDLISSGDAAADAQNHQLFVQKYDQMHRFVMIGRHTAVLYVGAENWPMPIPLKKSKAGWYFDAEAGRKEILARRIGNNELNAIDVCLAIVAAQNDYKSQLHDGDKIHQYAQHFVSSEGKHDGLYWKAAEPGVQSPLGPALAQASYKAEADGDATPYHGYIYKILTAQGSHAPGGAKAYMADGKLTNGFAVVAYPASYLVSGVVTFIVNQDGTVYQKDFGADTQKIASSITTYDPDSSWKAAN